MQNQHHLYEGVEEVRLFPQRPVKAVWEVQGELLLQLQLELPQLQQRVLLLPPARKQLEQHQRRQFCEEEDLVWVYLQEQEQELVQELLPLLQLQPRQVQHQRRQLYEEEDLVWAYLQEQQEVWM